MLFGPYSSSLQENRSLTNLRQGEKWEIDYGQQCAEENAEEAKKFTKGPQRNAAESLGTMCASARSQ